MGEMFAGRYELIDQIGEGGMGSVWRVRDHKTDRLVAAKLLRQSDAGSLLRFMREQGLRIEHNHVVTPLGWAGEDGRVIFTMPLLDGGSLSDLCKSYGALPPLLVAEFMRQLLDGLAACHTAGVVHRDIKPANILLEATGRARPSAWITDFGIAVSVDAPRLTSNEIVLGTPGYMSSEQAQGYEPHPLQDLYSAGMVGIQLLTGLRPGANTRVRPDDLPPRPANTPDSLWNLLVALAHPNPMYRLPSADEGLRWLSAPELAWQEHAAIDITDKLPPMMTSEDFRVVDPAAAGRAQDGHTDASAAPQALVTPLGPGQARRAGENTPTPGSGAGRTTGSSAVQQLRGAMSGAPWYAAPAAALLVLLILIGTLQPWNAGDGGWSPDTASIGGSCDYAAAGSTAPAKNGKTLTCTYQDGTYTWQDKG